MWYNYVQVKNNKINSYSPEVVAECTQRADLKVWRYTNQSWSHPVTVAFSFKYYRGWGSDKQWNGSRNTMDSVGGVHCWSPLLVLVPGCGFSSTQLSPQWDLVLTKEKKTTLSHLSTSSCYIPLFCLSLCVCWQSWSLLPLGLQDNSDYRRGRA